MAEVALVRLVPLPAAMALEAMVLEGLQGEVKWLEEVEQPQALVELVSRQGAP